ncbi:Ribonuclease H-like superfamily protein [Rhynchospora pubera]|uniref:Ribonuclease H-like superfamily protein n=1 Tax=Rhynchospora pubera TaxID=906938 RepID=A0AAV8EBZ7_9POAL|nr:Ribonuclease H-like superfamily protein [Rhynchospora pubera]
MKNAWELMRDGDRLWVKICQAKYYPKIGFWKATNTSGASSLWREVVKVRHHLMDDIRWEVNNGRKTYALSQPWFPNWSVHQEFNQRDTVKKVADLLDPQTGMWNMEDLQRLFGREKAEIIQNDVKIPTPECEMDDRLIWQKSKTGRYSVNEGYKELDLMTVQRAAGNIGVQWRVISKWNFIVPKVKIFLWRLLSRALPLANNIHRRIRAISPICQRCGQENEYESHCFFFCPGSRRVWFEGKLALRSHDQPLDITQAFTQTILVLDEEGIKVYSYTLWELWKGRNEVIMQHKQFDPVRIKKAVSNWMKEGYLENQRNQNEQQCQRIPGYEVKGHDWNLIVDASWQQSRKTGIAFMFYEHGAVTQWSSNFCEAYDPFHAEAMSLLDGLKMVVQKLQEDQEKIVNVFSDCQNLIVAVTEMNTDNIPSWRALKTVQELIKLYKSWTHNIQLRHVRRDAVQPAHLLANDVRRTMQAKHGNTFDCAYLLEMGIDLELDSNYFEIT